MLATSSHAHSSQCINRMQMFKQWMSERSQIVSMCPSGLFDTVYPVNVLDYWVSMFLREARLDYGGSFSEGALRAAIGDIQDHVAVIYGLQELSS